MKKLIFILLFILIIIGALVIGNYLFNPPQISETDKKLISQTVNNYYSDIENNKIEHVFSHIYFDEKNSNKYINNESKQIALKEVLQNVYEIFRIENPCNPEDIFYDKSEKAFHASVGLTLKYKGTSGGLATEVLYLNKFSANWKIIKIKTSDRYVVFRSNNYYIDWPLWFLLPNKQ